MNTVGKLRMRELIRVVGQAGGAATARRGGARLDSGAYARRSYMANVSREILHFADGLGMNSMVYRR